MTFSGSFSSRRRPSIQFSRGYTPVQTAPKPNAWDANNTFSAAAAQSTYIGGVGLFRLFHMLN